MNKHVQKCFSSSSKLVEGQKSTQPKLLMPSIFDKLFELKERKLEQLNNEHVNIKEHRMWEDDLLTMSSFSV